MEKIGNVTPRHAYSFLNFYFCNLHETGCCSMTRLKFKADIVKEAKASFDGFECEVICKVFFIE